MGESVLVALQLGLPLALLVLAYFTGGVIERRHYRSIREREVEWRHLPAVTFREVPAGWTVEGSALVTGNIVVSVDYFKRFLAGLRALVGGRIQSYESLLDRARREALLRMKADAVAHGFDAIINVRLETARTANTSSGNFTGGIEVIAFGTGLSLRDGLA